MRAPIHWVSGESVEALAFDCGYAIGVGHDQAHGDYAFVVTREGVEYRGRLAAAGAVAS